MVVLVLVVVVVGPDKFANVLFLWNKDLYLKKRRSHIYLEKSGYPLICLWYKTDPDDDDELITWDWAAELYKLQLLFVFLNTTSTQFESSAHMYMHAQLLKATSEAIGATAELMLLALLELKNSVVNRAAWAFVSCANRAAQANTKARATAGIIFSYL